LKSEWEGAEKILNTSLASLLPWPAGAAQPVLQEILSKRSVESKHQHGADLRMQITVLCKCY
jgi:hypothetical protein